MVDEICTLPWAAVGLALAVISVVLIVRPLPKLGRTAPIVVLLLAVLALVQSARTQAQVLGKERQQIDVTCDYVAMEIDAIAVELMNRPEMSFDRPAWRATAHVVETLRSLCVGEAMASCGDTLLTNPGDHNFIAGLRDLAHAYRHRVPCHARAAPAP